MLSVIFGECENAVYNTSKFFDNQYLDCWLEDDFASQVIAGVDRGKILSPNAIDTKVLGVIPTTKIAGGTKTLLLIKNMPQKIFNASTCGDNCARYLLKIGKMQDVTINLRHIMNFGKRKFTIKIINSGKTVHTMEELVAEAIKYI